MTQLGQAFRSVSAGFIPGSIDGRPRRTLKSNRSLWDLTEISRYPFPLHHFSIELLLSAKYILMMKIRDIAKALGRLGGRARAKKLSPERKKKIAAMGGLSRALSHHAVRRIEDNFRTLEAIEVLRKVARVHGK